MKGKDFLNSKWMKQASKPETSQKIKQNFNRWSSRVKNTGILGKANQLWQYFHSAEITGTQKLTIVACLLYIISPIDLIPDFIPIAGWLDDIGVAGFVLSYIFVNMDKLEEQKILDAEIDGTNVETFVEINQTDFSNDLPFDFSEHSSDSNQLIKNLDEISTIAKKLDAPQYDNLVDNIKERLQGQRMYNIVVAGRYSTGKSTLINALIGKNILPSSPTPTTKAVTYLMHGKENALFSEQSDGSIVVHENISDLVDLYNKDICNAKIISVATPEFPFMDLTIVDTPGLEDPKIDISQLTLDLIPEADILIVVLDANYLQSKNDFDFIQSLLNDDRDRKMFVVLNKIDGLSEKETEKIKKTCEATLVKYGVHNQKVYPLSAKNADQNFTNESVNLFTQFKNELSLFLNKSLKTETQRHLKNEVQKFATTLLGACDVTLSQHIEDKELMKKQKVNLEKERNQISATYSVQRKQLISKFQEYKLTFLNEFDIFFETLKMTAVNEINKASFSDLKSSDILSDRLNREIINYLEPKIKQLSEKLSSNLKDSEKQILQNLSNQSIAIDIKTCDIAHYSTLFMPVAVGTAFLTCGFFSFIFIGVIIGAVVGRNFFEGSISKFLKEVGAKKTREKMIPAVKEQLNNAKSKIKTKLEERFDNIQEDLYQIYSSSESKTISVVDIIEKNSTKENMQNVQACREKLGLLINDFKK